MALVDKHAPLKTVSNRKLKHFSKPWITSGLRKSIKIKNSLLQSGDLVNYKIYRNKISSLTRLSKKNYYHALFAENLNDMKNTWNGINRLINDKKNRKQVISSLKRPDDNSLTNDPLEISNIFNNYFSSVGKNLASRVPRSSRYFTEYLSPNYNPSSFFFDPVTPEEIEREILLIPKNKTYSLYSCPIRILTDARCVMSGPLSIIINISVQKGIFPSKLKKAKVVPV